MKLRIRGNTIRVRLKQSEVKTLATGRSLVEETRFPESVLQYRLDTNEEGDFSAEFQEGTLAIRLPSDAVAQWAASDQVSLLTEQQVGTSDVLSLLVEKDFACLSPGDHRHDEDDEDTYPHPAADSGLGC